MEERRELVVETMLALRINMKAFHPRFAYIGPTTFKKSKLHGQLRWQITRQRSTVLGNAGPLSGFTFRKRRGSEFRNGTEPVAVIDDVIPKPQEAAVDTFP